MLKWQYASMNSMIRGAPKGDFYMRANKVRNLLLIAVTGTALTLAGCGGRSVSSVDENDSTISSIASAASEDTMSEAGSISGNGVIAAQEIDPSAVTPSVSGDSVSSNDSSVSSNSSESTESTTESSTGYTSAGVNMRSDADQDSDVVNTIEKGEEVKVLGTKDGWTHVEYDGDEGYVKSTYISSTRPSSDDGDDEDDDDDEDSSDEEYTSDNSSSDDDDEDYSSKSSDNDDEEDTESSSEEASD